MDPEQNRTDLEMDATPQATTVDENGELANHSKLPLPVALRNDELAEEDFEALFRKAQEMLDANGKAGQPSPRKIPTGNGSRNAN